MFKICFSTKTIYIAGAMSDGIYLRIEEFVSSSRTCHGIKFDGLLRVRQMQ